VKVPFNTCPTTANLAVPKFVVGGEVLTGNTDTMENDVQTKTWLPPLSPSGYVNFTLWRILVRPNLGRDFHIFGGYQFDLLA
jgi:hypothetical protein